MKHLLKFFLLIFLFIPAIGVVHADSGPLPTQSSFLFQKNGKQLLDPVTFTVKCYGTSMVNNTSKTLKMTEFSGTCKSYGCKYETTNIFEVYKESINYCDISGEVKGQQFTVKNFLGKDKVNLKCGEVTTFDMATDDKYYQETPAYKACKAAVYNEYYPDGNNFICHKSLEVVSADKCDGGGYIWVNGICNQFTSETYACIAAMDAKEEKCMPLLKDVTSTIERGKDGYPFNDLCEVKIPVPTNIVNVSTNPTPLVTNKVVPTTTVTPTLDESPTVTVEPTQSDSQVEVKQNIFMQIIAYLRCTFLKLFRRSC